MIRFIRRIVLLALVTVLVCVVVVLHNHFSDDNPPPSIATESSPQVKTQTISSLHLKREGTVIRVVPQNARFSSNHSSSSATIVQSSKVRKVPSNKVIMVTQGRPLATQSKKGKLAERKLTKTQSPPNSSQLVALMDKDISKLPERNPKTMLHVIVSAYFRSGSTFLADVLQQNWGTFYFYEPLNYERRGRIVPNTVPRAMSVLKDLMHCNFTNPVVFDPQFMPFTLRLNRFLTKSCSKHTNICFKPDFDRLVCKRAQWQITKVNRLTLEQVAQFVQENRDLYIKVLHLVRDPRGIINSSRKVGWCTTSECTRDLCSQMDVDYWMFYRFTKLLKNRFFRIRFEDLSLSPVNTTKFAYMALGMPYTNSVLKFVETNTKTRPPHDENYPFSTQRDSFNIPVEWRKEMKLADIKKLQEDCSSVLKYYDYPIVSNSKQLAIDPKTFYASKRFGH